MYSNVYPVADGRVRDNWRLFASRATRDELSRRMPRGEAQLLPFRAAAFQSTDWQRPLSGELWSAGRCALLAGSAPSVLDGPDFRLTTTPDPKRRLRSPRLDAQKLRSRRYVGSRLASTACTEKVFFAKSIPSVETAF